MGLSDLIKANKQQLLVTPMHEQWLMRNSNVELDERVAQWVSRELQAKQRDRTKSWSASSQGSCQRKQIYQYFGVPPERGISADLSAIFQHGTWTHLKWQAMGYMAGWLGHTEIGCMIEDLNAKGTIDGILASGKAGWELKSINSRGFRFILSDGPKHEHLKQIHFYMIATGLRLWSLMYENKDTQDYKEFVVPYDEAIAMEVQLELEALNTAVADRTLPPMLAGCVSKSSANYRQCQYRDACEASLWPQTKLLIRRSSSPMS